MSDNQKKKKKRNEKDSKFDQIVMAKTQQAAAIIQLKLEGQIIKNHPEFYMEDRLLLDKIDYEKGTINIGGKEYKLLDSYFPTINPENPYELSEAEAEVVKKLTKSFKNSEKLQRHVQFLYAKGSIYKIFNDNLLMHGCVPMSSFGDFVTVNIEGRELKRKRIFRLCRQDSKRRIFRSGRFTEKRIC